MFNTSTIDMLLYLVLSLTTLVKILIVFTSSNHNLITDEFIAGQAVQFMGPAMFSSLLFFIILILLSVTQFMKQKHRYYITSILILLLSFVSIYNVNLLI